MFLVGKALKAHGVKGDVKIECYTDNPGVLLHIKKFIIDGQERSVEKIKQNGDFLLVKFVGVDDMNTAELFRNKQFYVKSEDMPVPTHDSYYISDLMGCTVQDEDAKKIGVISEVLQYGAADVFVVKNNGATIMFPHLKSVLIKVDISEKTVVVNRKEFDKVAVYED